MKRLLDKEDLIKIADLLKTVNNEQANEYAQTLKLAADVMCSDDYIEITEYSVDYSHS